MASSYDGPLDIMESQGSEVADPNVTHKRVDTAKEATDESAFESTKVANHSIPEHVVFCIDSYFSKVSGKEPNTIRNLCFLIYNYMELKRSFSTHAVKYGILLLGNEATNYYSISTRKHVNNVLVALCKMEEEEVKPYDFDQMFTQLTEVVNLPNESLYNKNKPPPNAYHFILFFARKKFLPTLSSSNAYYFIMSSSYVNLDILYICDRLEKRQNKIVQALEGLVGEKGYFYRCGTTEFENQQSFFHRFLGNCMVRRPQKTALFNVLSLKSINAK